MGGSWGDDDGQKRVLERGGGKGRGKEGSEVSAEA